jgi:hypothetical protein
MKWLSILGCLFSLAASGASLETLVHSTGPLRSGTVTLPNLSPASQYSLLYSLSPLRELGPNVRVAVELRQGAAVLASKTLHAGDPDYYCQFRVPASGIATLTVRAVEAPVKYTLQVNRWPLSSVVASKPNHRWQDAFAISLGKTVFASRSI